MRPKVYWYIVLASLAMTVCIGIPISAFMGVMTLTSTFHIYDDIIALGWIALELAMMFATLVSIILTLKRKRIAFYLNIALGAALLMQTVFFVIMPMLFQAVTNTGYMDPSIIFLVFFLGFLFMLIIPEQLLLIVATWKAKPMFFPQNNQKKNPKKQFT